MNVETINFCLFSEVFLKMTKRILEVIFKFDVINYKKLLTKIEHITV